MPDGSTLVQQIDLFNKVASKLSTQFESNRLQWEESPYSWMLGLSSRTKGALGEELVRGWAKCNGFTIEKTKSSDYDLSIDGIRIEVKLSTLWETGNFKFQQLRDQNYDQVFCLGIAPFEVSAWIVPKEVLWEIARGQHGGKKARDTREVFFKASKPPEGLATYGRTLEEAHGILSTLSKLDSEERMLKSAQAQVDYLTNFVLAKKRKTQPKSPPTPVTPSPVQQ